MASGHVNRANRPNTWLRRPALQREETPCQPGSRPHMAQSRRPGRTIRASPTRSLRSLKSRSPIMPYPLPPRARAWQEKVRRFVSEELIPCEVEAEMNQGELPPEVRARHRRRAKEIGLSALASRGAGRRRLELPGADGHPGGDRQGHQRARLVLRFDAALDGGG